MGKPVSRMLMWSFLACTAVACGWAAPASNAVRESFDIQVPFAPRPVASDGARQLVYELHLTNFSKDALDVLRIEVATSDTEPPIAAFEGSALKERLSTVQGARAGEATIVPPGARAVLYLELGFSPDDELPGQLQHRVTYSADDGGAQVRGGVTRVDRVTPARIGPPLKGGPWVAIHHPAWPRGHRRMFYTIDGGARIPGRYAIDWVKTDNTGRTKSSGDPDLVEQSLSYGLDVLAVADARVAAVRDDMPEPARISETRKHAIGDATGNFLALDLGGSTYVFYEHLKPGSIRVAPGQRVRRGQVIAQIGFTGDSTGPHLHLHVADRLSPLGAEGLPFEIDRFTVVGRYEDAGQIGKHLWMPAGGGPQTRSGEWPASNSVVLFPDH